MRIWRGGARPSVAFEAYGVPVRIGLAEESLREALFEILPPGARPIDGASLAPTFALRRSAPDDYAVAVGEEPLLLVGTLELALQALDQQIRLHIAANARDWIFVHAGVVAADGGAIVLPGPSFCGKTTLVMALLELGASYYSDEYAVLDPEGQVHPYPRRPSVRGGLGEPDTERQSPDVGPAVGTRPAAVRLLAAVPYRPGGSPSWQPISRTRAVAAVLSHTVPAQARPRQSLRTVGRALAHATLLEGERGEALPAARKLLRELQSATAGAP